MPIARPPQVPAQLAGTRFSTDYTGRLVDSLIFQGINFAGAGGTELPVQLLFGDDERVISGAQKMIQRWVIAFLTKRRSVQANPNIGSEFMQNLEQGYVVTDADVQSEFLDAAVLTAESLAVALANQTVPEDEQLESSELLSFDLQPGSLSLRIRITSVAGEGATVLLPIPLE